MKDIELPPCPFCGSAPRYLEHKAGFYSERVICDSCGFYLPPERWLARAAVEADRAQRVPEGWQRGLELLLSNSTYQSYSGAIRCIDCDAAKGQPHKEGCAVKTASDLLASTPAQPAQQEPDWKDMYEKEKRRSAMWIAKYEKDIGPLEYAVPVSHQEPPQPVERKPTLPPGHCASDWGGRPTGPCLYTDDEVMEILAAHGIRE